MPYYECAGCGQLVDLERHDGAPRRERCPVCAEQTTWTPAFEADAGVRP